MLCAKIGRRVEDIKILAATKTVEPKRINELAKLGAALAGENRVQELLSKYNAVKGVEWHFVGHLQTNKVKYIVDKVTLIHSVDRASLVDEINKQSKKIGKIMQVLIEINAGNEDSKSGVRIGDIEPLYAHINTCANVQIKGFMPMLPIGASEDLYKKMQEVFVAYAKRDSNINTLSMGMTDDYLTAIAHGATIVRLGSCLFGAR